MDHWVLNEEDDPQHLETMRSSGYFATLFHTCTSDIRYSAIHIAVVERGYGEVRV
jgi:hypothetical protein